MMTLVEQSAGLLLDVSVKALLLAVLAGAALAVCRVRSSNVRHRVWTVVLAAMVLLPLLVEVTPAVPLPAGVVPAWQARIRVEPVTAPIAASGGGQSHFALRTAQKWDSPRLAAKPQAEVARGVGESGVASVVVRDGRATAAVPLWLAALVSVYAIVAVVFVGRLASAMLRVRALVRGGRPAKLPPGDAFAVDVAVLESDAVRVPLTVGWRRPVILLPADWPNWSAAMLAAVLRHEQTHVARGDHWITLLAEWNRAVYWFHPVAWFLRRRLATLAEAACDDAVIELLGDRTGYARHLLEVAGRLSHEPRRLQPASVAMARTPQVEHRINAILDAHRPLARRLGLAGAIALVVVAVPLVLLAAGLKPGDPPSPAAAPVAEAANADAKATSDASAASPEKKPAAAKAVLSGRIVDTTGAPVTDARLTLTSSDWKEQYETKTDADGRYAFDVVKKASEFQVRITSVRWVGLTNWKLAPRFRLTAESHMVQDFTLQRACRIRVRAVDEAGAPIKGVSLYPALLADDRIDNAELVSTGKEGWATIGGLVPSDVDYLITAMDDDYAFGKLVVRLDDPEQVVSREIVLAKGVDVPGTAVCTDGKPPAGWRIKALPTWWRIGNSPGGKKIAADGSFTLHHIVPDTYDVTINIPIGDQLSTTKTVLATAALPPAEGPLSVTLDYPSPGTLATITGKVHYTGGTPRRGVWIMANSSNGMGHGSTHLEPGETEFRIGPVPPGDYRVEFTADDVEQVVRNDVIAPTADLDVTVRVIGTLQLKGHVVRAAGGEPVERFRVRVQKIRTLSGPNYVMEPRWYEFNGGDGEFAVDVPGPGVYRVLAAADGLAWTWSSEVSTADEASRAIKVELTPGASLTGTVVDDEGRPIRGATVTPLSRAGGFVQLPLVRFETDDGAVKTAGGGRFTFEHLAVGKETLRVTHPDYNSAVVENIDVPAGGATAPPITLHRGGTVTGLVLDGEGRPQADVTLLFQDAYGYGGFSDEAAGRLGTAVTGADGRYVVRGLPEQLCYVRRSDLAKAVGVVCNAIVPQNGRTLSLDFGGPDRVTGRLVVDGTPLANARVELAGDNPNFGVFKAYAQTDANGKFVFWGPPDGVRTLYYELPGTRGKWAFVRHIQVTGGPQDLGTIQHTSVTVYVQIEGLPPEAVRQLQLRLQQFDPVWTFGNQVGSDAVLDRSGDAFKITGVPPGDYELLCWRPDYVTLRQRVSIRPDAAEQTIAVDWPPGTASISGRMSEQVCGPGGGNPPNLWSKDHRLWAVLRFHEDGTYRIENLPAGDYYLTDKDTRNAAPVVEFSLAAGEHKTLDLTPETYTPRPLDIGMLIVRVLTDEGIPLTGCDVKLAGPRGVLSPSAAQNGEVHFVGPPGRYRLTVSYPGFASVERAVTIAPTGPDGRVTGNCRVDVRLQSAGG